MNEVAVKMTDNMAEIDLSGHIDSANAAQVEEEIRKQIGGTVPGKLIVDARNLKYISSAGLRILLRLRKECEDVTIRNVSNEIYEILEMTGFSEMMTVEKAFRELSVDGCELIGQGANGKVYRIDRDTIVKVYMDPDSLNDIKREREMARKALILGIPTAIPYDVVRVGDLYGSVFELLNAESFASIIIRQPERTDEIINMAMDLLKKIHGTEVKPGEMPTIRETAIGWVKFLEPYLPEEIYKKELAMIEEVPVVNRMLHGDYHFKNLMLQDGEALLIDMDTLCVGHPIFEFAALFSAYRGFAVANHDNCEQFLGLSYEKCGEILSKMFRSYFTGYTDEQLEEVQKMASVISYSRIMRRTIRRQKENEGQDLIDACRQQIIELVPQVDKLYF